MAIVHTRLSVCTWHDVLVAVNVAEAGEGSMEISITPSNGKNLPNEVRPVGSGMFEVSFTPTHPGNHRASVLFNNEHVQGMCTSFNVYKLIADSRHFVTQYWAHGLYAIGYTGCCAMTIQEEVIIINRLRY